MAVEIPVVIDIEGAFNDAAKRVESASAPLKRSLKDLNKELAEYMDVLKSSTFAEDPKLFMDMAREVQVLTQEVARANEQILMLSSSAGSIQQMGVTLSSLTRQWEELGGAEKYSTDASGSRVLSDRAKQILSDYRAVTAEIQRSGQSLAQVVAEEEKIIALKKRGASARQYETAVLKSNIQSIRILSEQQRILSERLQRAPVGSEQFQKLSIQLQIVETRLKEVQIAANGTGNAMSTTASAVDRAKTSIDRTSQSLQKQTGLWAQLKSMATMYISVFGGLRFADNIRKTTAELEMQRIALGSIIRDTDRANDLFREIKAAALKSPFEIKDLVTYTKQLAAYKIETEDLFKVTTRLADVSAGLGVDMNRLILAYGQVRAASVLRGQELRQFTEAGIPLVEKLAEKFQELGREGTTTADVFELISQRAVPFRMIEEIFDDMTSAGGEFYKMQELQSETLKGQWMKLKDAITIMYDEIGNTPQVHKAMEDLIQGALSLTRSWREASRWLATIGGSLAAYAVVSRSAAVATNALTYAEALSIAKEKERMIMLPKVVAAIIGEERAKRLSVRATMRLTAAQAALASSTTLVTRAFNAAKVAILSNPYAIAAAGIAAVGLGIYTIIKNSKQAEVSIESLEGAFASLREQTSKTSDALSMVKDYEELSAKVDRTAGEQKKLDRITKELAKTFPAAISGIDKESNALEINTNKVKELTLAEQKLAEQRLRTTAKEAEDQIPELEKEREKLLDKALKGRKVDIWGGREMLSSEDLEEVEKRISEINTKLEKYREAIEAVQDLDFIGPLPVAAKTDEELTAWKQKLSQIQEAKVKAGMVQVFSPDEIKKLGSVSDLWKKTREGIKNAEKELAAFKALSLTLTDEDAIKANQKNIEQTEKVLEFWKEIKKTYGFVFGSGSQRDTRLSQLKSEISELTNAYKKFLELKKYKSEDEALVDIKQLFPQLGEVVPTLDNVVAELERKLEQVRNDLKKSPKSKTLLDMQRALETEISNLKFDELKRALDEKLKKLSDEIKRSETARNFYKDIFDLTGDEKLAASLSVDVYGGIGNDFKERVQQQLNEIFSDLTVDADMRKAINEQDWDYIFKHLPEGTDKIREELIKLRDAQQKFSADRVKGWMNDLKKEKTYAEKRIELARYTQEKIAEINKTVSDPQERFDLTMKYLKREQEQASKLRYESFKESPLYIQMFGDLDSASGSMLRTMRNNIKEVMSSWKNLKPTELKEMQSRLREIEKQLAKKNPFTTLYDSVKRYYDLLATGRTKESDNLAMVKADDNLKKQQAALESAQAYAIWAKQQYEAAQKMYPNDTKRLERLKAQSEQAENQVKSQQILVNKAKEAADLTAKNAADWDDVSKGIQAAADELTVYASHVSEIGSAVSDLLGTTAGQEAADVSSRITKITQSTLELTAAILMLVSNVADVSAWVKAVAALLAITSQVAEWSGAGGIEKWDKQMKTQEKTISRLTRKYEQLEYAIADSFGNDYLYNYNQQLKALEAQAEATVKQIEIQRQKAEKASGKENREAAAEEAERLAAEYDKITQSIRDIGKEMQETFAGSSLTQAAEDFASAWLDAYQSYASTTDAIKEKMEDMVKTLVVKAAMAGLVQAILRPWYQQLEKYGDEGTVVQHMGDLVQQLYATVDQLDSQLAGAAQLVQSYGVDLRSTVGNFRGISRDIANASEESILGLAAGINTQNFYMQSINENVSQIVALLGGARPAQTVTGASDAENALPSVQFVVNEYLPGIREDIAEMKVLLQSVISSKNASTSSHAIGIRML